MFSGYVLLVTTTTTTVLSMSLVGFSSNSSHECLLEPYKHALHMLASVDHGTLMGII